MNMIIAKGVTVRFEGIKRRRRFKATEGWAITDNLRRDNGILIKGILHTHMKLSQLFEVEIVALVSD